MAYILKTDKAWHETQYDLSETMRKWGVTEWKTNRPRGAQQRYGFQSEQARTVRLTYSKDGKEVHLTMDTQERAVDNLRVLYLAVEAVRLNEARGIADVVESAYLQLAAPPKRRDPYEVLGIRPDAPLAVAEAAWKALIRKAHPDAGGSAEQVKELNQAIEEIRNQAA